MRASLMSVLLVAVLAACSGCTSLWSLQCSRDEILRNRVLASGDQGAIKALRFGAPADVAIRAVQVDNGAGIGVDVSNLAALAEHPWRQLGAAVLDAGMIYGAYLGARAIESSSAQSSTSEENQSAGRDSITIYGKDAVINVGNTTTSTAE